MDYEGKPGAVGQPEESGRPARKAMTVSEAGRKGGITVRDERGHAFYEEIGRKGGQKVRELIQRGKQRG
jgi:general stress protein YciG